MRKSTVVIVVIVIIIALSLLSLLAFCTNNRAHHAGDIDVYSLFSKDIIRNILKKKLGNIPIFIINLKRSIKRKKFMIAQFDHSEIRPAFIEAIDGQYLKNTTNGSFTFSNGNSLQFYQDISSKESKSELACLLSHIVAIRKAYDSGQEAALIMEDDVFMGFVPFWKESIQNIVEGAPRDWKLINFILSENDGRGGYTPYSKNCFGTFAYVINRRGMNDILQFMDGNVIRLLRKDVYNTFSISADKLLYDRIRPSYHFNKFTTFYPMNHNMDSTIHTSHTKGHITTFEKQFERIINDYSITDPYAWISKIFYINLDHRKDRNMQTLQFLNSMGVPSHKIHRIRAIADKNGALGCLKSHIKAMQLATKTGGHVIIMEDDVEVINDYETAKDSIQRIFRHDFITQWDVVMLAMNERKTSPAANGLVRVNEALTTSFYLISFNYISKLLNAIEANLKEVQEKGWKEQNCADRFWFSLQRSDRWFGLLSRQFKQREDFSDIENKIVNYDR